MNENSYAIRTELSGEFKKVLERVKSEFLKQGFGVLT